MGQILLDLIHQLNSAVWALIVILLAAFWAMYKLGQIIDKFSVFKDENKDIKVDIKEMNNTLSKINATTDLLYQAHLRTVRSHSPLGLSDVGETIGKDLNFDQKIANHWDKIKQTYFSNAELKNPYDIQTVAMQTAPNAFESTFTDKEKDEVKLYAYQKGYNLLEIYPVIGIKIRNKIMSERNMPLEEIDKYAPKSQTNQPGQ